MFMHGDVALWHLSFMFCTQRAELGGWRVKPCSDVLSITAYRLQLNIELAIGLSQLLHNRLVEIIWSNCDYLRWLWSLCTLNSNHILPLKLWAWASWRKHWLNQWREFNWPMAFMEAMCNSSYFYNYFWGTLAHFTFMQNGNTGTDAKTKNANFKVDFAWNNYAFN